MCRRGVELRLVPVELGGVDVGVVEEVVLAGVRAHGHRQQVHVERDRGLVASRVAQLVVVVDRDAEEAVLLPLEGDLRLALGPDVCDAVALEDVDDLFERHAERRDRLSRGYLQHVDMLDAPVPLEADDGGGASAQRPVPAFEGAGVLDVVAGVDRHVLLGQPAVVGVVAPEIDYLGKGGLCDHRTSSC